MKRVNKVLKIPKHACRLLNLLPFSLVQKVFASFRVQALGTHEGEMNDVCPALAKQKQFTTMVCDDLGLFIDWGTRDEFVTDSVRIVYGKRIIHGPTVVAFGWGLRGGQK